MNVDVSMDKKNNNEDHYWLDSNDNRDQTHFWRGASSRERRRRRALQDWYGIDRARLERVEHRRPAKPVADMVSSVLEKFGMDGMVLLSELEQHWGEIVGSDNAKQTRPVAFRAGHLDVEVANASWRYMLELEGKPTMLAKLRSFSDNKIKSLRFVPPGRFSDSP